MDINNMKNIVIIKNLPSNLLEQAIIVVKNKKEVINKDYLKRTKENKNFIQGYMKEDDLRKIENIQKDKREYVIKEAESVIKNYIEQIDKINNNKKQIEIINKKYYKIKYINIVLLFISIISTAICIIK